MVKGSIDALIIAINNLNAELLGFTEAIIGSYNEFFGVYFPLIIGYIYGMSFINGLKFGNN